MTAKKKATVKKRAASKKKVAVKKKAAAKKKVVAAKKTTTSKKKAATKKAKARKAASKTTRSRVAKPVSPRPPASIEIAEGPEPENGDRVPSSTDVHVLVVDDEPDVHDIVVPFLKSQGYTVSSAMDGDQAYEMIHELMPDIVLLDVMMPGRYGWEVARDVRNNPALNSVRIIMATGIGEEANAATSPLYGADAHLNKPFKLRELSPAVRGVIDRIEAGEFD